MMTFKWTYLAAALVVIGAFVAVGVAGGVWGAVSLGWGLVAILLAGLIVVMAWRGQRQRIPTTATAGTTTAPFEGYPTDKALAIFDAEQDARGATDELRASGYDDVTRFQGIGGAVRLDASGAEHGVGTSIGRSIDHVASDESDLKRYDEAVREGHIVIGVYAPHSERRQRVADIMRRHRGHDVAYFGSMAVESMNPDPVRIRAD